MGVTLVTGGAKRLGAEMCRALVAHGHKVVIHYRNSSEEARALVDELGTSVEMIQGDFESPESMHVFIQDYLERFPSTHYLVNNVGNYEKGALLSLSDEMWQATYQTNLHAPFSLTKALLGELKGVVNIGLAGLDAWRTDPHSSLYRMTKMGLWMMTRSLARELTEKNVRVNMVSPGQLEQSVDHPEDLSLLPMKRLGTFKEVARLVAFLLDEENSYITGQNIEVAGGLKL